MKQNPSHPLFRPPAVVLCLLALGACDPPPPPAELNINEQLSGEERAAGFTRADQAREFRFPEDHGPHSGYRTEWWYLTGNLRGAAGRPFGFHLTFFRIAISPKPPPPGSAWATRHVWMAHLALSDLQGKRHYSSERFAREALGLAGTRRQPLAIWVENWHLSREADGGAFLFSGATPEFSLELRLAQAKKPVLQGDQGLSQKSGQAGNASYYYSLTRLPTAGWLELKGQRLAVAGQSWLDREWSSSALGPQQQGWDWFALQFEDGRELMYYRLRHHDGQTDPHSAGSLVARDGGITRLSPANTRLTPLRYWTSPDGHKTYPIAWRLELPASQQAWRVEALLDDQEIHHSVRYWEGAVRVLALPGQREVGRGYLELAGY